MKTVDVKKRRTGIYLSEIEMPQLFFFYSIILYFI